MNRRKTEKLMRLKGCEDCKNLTCLWNSEVATKSVANVFTSKYNCNTSKRK